MYNVLIGTSGSVAALKLPLIVEQLLTLDDAEVKFVSTHHSLHFFDRQQVKCEVLTDEDEWSRWTKRGDPVLHIELRRWADLFVIAPLDANTLAKISTGICDNLLTCVVRAWDLSKPLLFALAMNTCMLDHPITSQQVSILLEWGYKEIPCVEKLLVCGDKGKGAMAEVSTIVTRIDSELKSLQKKDT
ncbi:hypothetical protein LOTGIDRAFT_111587 [Lottia gigantea]|uniref:Phosphopantothenoylcysteine decarboxylase n=1 Tax=Lottia gigantea TaxID=225164 RepID=V4CGN0_LOTGI|nr:hypothetical protein LOTGIDRAFT_111587 [Lottia gigantea]ESP01250.1 hypothetical protein LOTGIDRAFT_111587 [Lottia gigantea]